MSKRIYLNSNNVMRFNFVFDVNNIRKVINDKDFEDLDSLKRFIRVVEDDKLRKLPIGD